MSGLGFVHVASRECIRVQFFFLKLSKKGDREVLRGGMGKRGQKTEVSHLQRIEMAITRLWDQVAAVPFRYDVKTEVNKCRNLIVLLSCSFFFGFFLSSADCQSPAFFFFFAASSPPSPLSLPSCVRILLNIVYGFVLSAAMAGNGDLQDVPDYYQVVTTPMSLSTVLGKLGRQEYATPSTVRGDMAVMFNNCFTYNMPGAPIYNYGKQLKQAFEDLLVEVGMEGRKRPASARDEFGSSLQYSFIDPPPDVNADTADARFHSGVGIGQRPFKKLFIPKIVGGESKRSRAEAPVLPTAPSNEEEIAVEEGATAVGAANGDEADQDMAPSAPPSPKIDRKSAAQDSAPVVDIAGNDNRTGTQQNPQPA